MESCLLLLILLMSSPIFYLINGLVLSLLWEWFVVPLGVPSLTIPMAIGISMVVGFLTNRYNTKTSQDKRTQGEKLFDGAVVLLVGLVSPFITLGIGWLVLQFI